MQTRHTPPGGTKHSVGLRRKSDDFPTGGAPPRIGRTPYNLYACPIITVVYGQLPSNGSIGSNATYGLIELLRLSASSPVKPHPSRDPPGHPRPRPTRAPARR
jgi:hypothetical protein